MKTAGILCEYNPFHNGHAFQIAQARENGADCIVAVMSGHFLQRGGVSVFSKWTRAEAALFGGADLVLELPAVYACSSAERFAEGGIALLDALGCVDAVSFGSESGDIDAHLSAARACLLIERSPEFQSLLKTGMSYPAAREKAVRLTCGNETAALLTRPNDTLGVEYCKALLRRQSAIQPETVLRKAPHDGGGDILAGQASGMYLRERIHEAGLTAVQPFVPQKARALYERSLSAGHALIDTGRLELMLLHTLRTMSKADFAKLPDVTEGLENRLYTAAQAACTIEEFYAAVKTKRYTHSRIRRIAHYALLGLRQEDFALTPTYIRVLAANAKGMELLRLARKTAALPCITSFKRAAHCRIAEIERRATDLYMLALPRPRPTGADFTQNIILHLAKTADV